MPNDNEEHHELRWSLNGIEGATLRAGREKHLDKELELPAEEIIELRVPVMQEMYTSLKEIIEQNGWEEEEGVRTILAAGLGYTRVRMVEEAREEGEIDDNEYRARISSLDRLMSKYEANYSVMKFKAYQFQEKARILEMRLTGLKGTERLREAWALRVRDRLEALEEEHRELEGRMAEHQQGQPSDPASMNWWERLRALWTDFNSGGEERTSDSDRA